MRRRLLPGPHVLLGFATLCDGAWGRPCRERDLPLVAPTVVGGMPLPFPCPHCGAVRSPAERAACLDPVRGFLWCPACRGRYRLDPTGLPLPSPLPPGARAAPCRVTVGGASWILDLNSEADVLDLLEAA